MKSIIQLLIFLLLLVLLLTSVRCSNKIVQVKQEDEGKGRKARYRQSPGPWIEDYAPIEGPHKRN